MHIVTTGWIDVAWDSGGSNSYRMGAEGKYDLMLAPSHDPEKVRKDSTSSQKSDDQSKVKVIGAEAKQKVSIRFSYSVSQLQQILSEISIL